MGLLLAEEPKIHYPAEVLLVPDDPGEFAASAVDIQHIDIKSVFVVGEKDAITATVRASLAEAELGVVEVAVGGGWYGYGVLAHDNGNRCDGGLRGQAIGTSIVRVIIDAEEVLVHVHHLVFGRKEDACADGDLDLAVVECHGITGYFFYRQAVEGRFADAFVYARQCEAGHVSADVLIVDLCEIVLFAAIVWKVQVLRSDGGSDEREQQTQK